MKSINKTTVFIVAASLLGGLFIGWLLFSRPASSTHDHEAEASAFSASVWTCSMHPSIRQNEPGKCPICGMDLIPLSQDEGDDNPLEVKMSDNAIRLANIQTITASLQPATKEVQLTGKVQPNEMNIYSQTSHIGGRVEALRVNFTGEYVRKGQVLANVYSPELVTAQKELFEAFKIRESQPELYQAAREKLSNWKLTAAQIDKILEDGKIRENLSIYADVSGIVIQKSVNLGDYIKKGAVLYQIANLSKLWILFDVHESDIPWIKVGSQVTYSVQSLPGESFEGKIDFIDPVINARTRVAKARITVSNKDLRLKPEMFVNGRVETVIQEESLIIPKSAVLWTGSRSIVYIKKQSTSGIAFELREVVLGPTLGDSYIVKEGLDVGDELVVNGAFSVDAAAQLAGKASMMNPDGGGAATHDHGAMKNNFEEEKEVDIPTNLQISNELSSQLEQLVANYIVLKNSLVNDDFKKASDAANKYWQSYEVIEMSSFTGAAQDFWMQEGAPVKSLAIKIRDADKIEEARAPFKPLSYHMINLVKGFQPSGKTIFVQYCPMADGFKGASWLSYEDNIYNPYFGAAMLTCGEVTDTINAKNEADSKPKSNVKSPPVQIMANIGETHVHIDYSSPRVRGRVIFGGLVPYNEVWSTGAHKATAISFSKDVRINDKVIPAGKYGLFTIPGEDTWTVIINKNWDQHLADEYDQKDDVLRFKVTPEQETELMEELTFKIQSANKNRGSISFHWANTSFKFSIEIL
jgi:Cu(I)/Ag(I) efflux system membrane fusion protein